MCKSADTYRHNADLFKQNVKAINQKITEKNTRFAIIETVNYVKAIIKHSRIYMRNAASSLRNFEFGPPENEEQRMD